MSVLMVFGLALFSGCASMTGRTAGEHIDDATLPRKLNAIIVKDPDAQYLKIDVSSEKRFTQQLRKCCSPGFHTQQRPRNGS